MMTNKKGEPRVRAKSQLATNNNLSDERAFAREGAGILLESRNLKIPRERRGASSQRSPKALHPLERGSETRAVQGGSSSRPARRVSGGKPVRVARLVPLARYPLRGGGSVTRLSVVSPERSSESSDVARVWPASPRRRRYFTPLT